MMARRGGGVPLLLSGSQSRLGGFLSHLHAFLWQRGRLHGQQPAPQRPFSRHTHRSPATGEETSHRLRPSPRTPGP